jgi:hypothetical protein
MGWPKGKPRSEDEKKRISIGMRGKNTWAKGRKLNGRGSKTVNWKGPNASYIVVHHWVERHLGRPRKCAKCATETAKIYDWANKSGQYKRQLDDWIRLCRDCHAKYDKAVRVPKWKEAVKKLGWKTT